MFIGNIFDSDTGVDTGDIPASLRFRGAQWLSRTPSVTGNRQKWIALLPVKRSKLGAIQYLISAVGSSRVTRIGFDASDRLVIYSATSAGGGDGGEYISNRVFRDPTSEQFIVIAYDSTQATAGDRIKAWVNQDQITSWATSTAPTLNHDTQFNWTGAAMEIGRYNATNYFEGYGARLSIVDGGSGDNTTFGALNTTINEWVSKSASAVKAVVDAGGTNSSMLDFNDATSLTTLGNDYSSKNNDWTLNNFSLTAGTTYDHMLDVPGNSFATLNPIDKDTSTVTLSNANLNWASGAPTYNQVVRASVAVSTGKWYWEVTPLTNGAWTNPGVADAGGSLLNASRINPGGWVYQGTTGSKVNNGTTTAYGATFTNNDVIGVALDMDAGSLTFYKNGVSQGVAYSTGLAGKTIAPMLQDAANDSTAAINFGQAPLHASATYHSAAGGYFRYAPPTGFKALCQRNLSDSGAVIVSGTFTGNASTDGPVVWMNGVPDTLTINSNAVTFGTHADKLATGFKLRTSSASYNTAGSNTWTATITSDLKNIFKYNNAQSN